MSASVGNAVRRFRAFEFRTRRENMGSIILLFCFFTGLLEVRLGRGWLSNHLKGLILAQNERWRRGLGMQVERQAQKDPFGVNPEWRSGKRGSHTQVTYPQVGDSCGKLQVIPDDLATAKV